MPAQQLVHLQSSFAESACYQMMRLNCPSRTARRRGDASVPTVTTRIVALPDVVRLIAALPRGESSEKGVKGGGDGRTTWSSEDGFVACALAAAILERHAERVADIDQ